MIASENEIEQSGFVPVPPRGPPRTLNVIALLVFGAAIFSFLLAYCLVNALVAAEVMTRWQSGRDPRPKVFLIAFGLTLTIFGSIAAFVRSISRKQLHRIDEMGNDPAE